MTRRGLLKLALTTCGAAAGANGSGLASVLDAAPATGSSRALGSLREVAASRGILFGTEVGKNILVTVSKYADLVVQQCGILVPGMELKWDALRPAPDQFDFTQGDWIAQFARSHGMQLRGHTLVWEQALPKWFVPTVNLDNAKQFMFSHISTVVGHYVGQIHSWDVVNEGVRVEDGRADGLKVTPWLIYMGPEYIDLAFHAAHQADPKAMLVYNENWIEAENPAAEQEAARSAVPVDPARTKRGSGSRFGNSIAFYCGDECGGSWLQKVSPCRRRSGPHPFWSQKSMSVTNFCQGTSPSAMLWWPSNITTTSRSSFNSSQ